ncbi:hypothetical protein EYF80_046702 [Liparis tanakae]|uniref:Uncharacterized protein n=1 Tax=Liparis tanakae TaxID=230148 RepID=A0A4Z2FPP2_9TELE|nr:hypothetical protein EYF80_046702 [Liparis tanakae]
MTLQYIKYNQDAREGGGCGERKEGMAQVRSDIRLMAALVDRRTASGLPDVDTQTEWEMEAACDPERVRPPGLPSFIAEFPYMAPKETIMACGISTFSGTPVFKTLHRVISACYFKAIDLYSYTFTAT